MRSLSDHRKNPFHECVGVVSTSGDKRISKASTTSIKSNSDDNERN